MATVTFSATLLPSFLITAPHLLLVSDDGPGSIWRITHEGRRQK
jgi:hypothetical protein